MRIGIAAGIGIGDRNAAEPLPRHFDDAIVIVVGIEQ
jgi:hypothetical protein